jgi:hypothetical protein
LQKYFQKNIKTPKSHNQIPNYPIKTGPALPNPLCPHPFYRVGILKKSPRPERHLPQLNKPSSNFPIFPTFLGYGAHWENRMPSKGVFQSRESDDPPKITKNTGKTGQNYESPPAKKTFEEDISTPKPHPNYRDCAMVGRNGFPKNGKSGIFRLELVKVPS